MFFFYNKIDSKDENEIPGHFTVDEVPELKKFMRGRVTAALQLEDQVAWNSLAPKVIQALREAIFDSAHDTGE